MRRTFCVALITAAICCSIIVGLQQLGRAAEERPVLTPEGTVTTTTLPPKSPVVAAIPHYQETNFEQDPFDSSRVRSSRTTTLSVLLVRADGTCEVHKAPK